MRTCRHGRRCSRLLPAGLAPSKQRGHKMFLACCLLHQCFRSTDHLLYCRRQWPVRLCTAAPTFQPLQFPGKQKLRQLNLSGSVAAARLFSGRPTVGCPLCAAAALQDRKDTQLTSTRTVLRQQHDRIMTPRYNAGLPWRSKRVLGSRQTGTGLPHCSSPALLAVTCL